MDKLNHFGDCSGLTISLSKSSFFSAGISVADLDSIKSITGFSQGSFPFRYLGIPVADSRLTIGQFSPFIDKISDYISAWAGASLSYAGRTELIKSVLQGVECFWLSVLPIPSGVRSKVTQLCRNFLWSGKCTMNKRPLVAWKEVTLPKMEGGLGIRNSKAWNKALLTKTLWDIQAKTESLWVKWVHQRYMNRGSFWDYQIKHEDSPLLKQVIAIRDEITGAEGSVENAIILLNQWAPNGEFQSKLAYEFFRPKSPKLPWPKLGVKSGPRSRVGWVFLNTMQTIKTAVKWMIKEAKGIGLPAKIKKIAYACTVYLIGGARNKRNFEGKIEHPEAIFRCIQIQTYRSIYNLLPDYRPI
ncbi:hypothetical protein Acr_28g0001240 [Actinidia rufa]|uniref:Uncharacterized protein n=1 Tax=Actinidia rufa TaxID=165716 RepID=A0A7J0H8N2_9ERIC|nr:hypothetical protein Acr_28g0001240 [Actinidia rufa]